MGSYLKPGSTMFRGSLRSQIYVDKSGLIEKTNKVINTEQKYICVSRPRRFGKSMALNMLASYYGKAENTESLFQQWRSIYFREKRWKNKVFDFPSLLFNYQSQ